MVDHGWNVLAWFGFCLTSRSTIFSHFGTEPPLHGYLPVLSGA